MNAKPRLRSDITIVAQTYRGEQSYIVKDPVTHKYFRFRPLEVVVMQALDGQRTPADAAAALGEDGLPISTDTVTAFARRLGRLGLLERSLSERSVLQLERLRGERRRRLQPAWLRGDILRLRWALSDPDALLERWIPRLRFCFTPLFLALSTVVFAAYFVIVGAKWPDFVAGIARLTDPGAYTLGLFTVFWGTCLVVIVIHELGHAVACKYFGGQVHEIGIMLIYFQPAFYCNVNDAWTFPDLRARLWVTAAGSWIQLLIAGLAAVVWWAATPGTVISDIALAAVVFGGITTIIANVNPLIPLDGYYALSDWLEVPNLRQRAFGHLGWWVKRNVLRLDTPEPPADERERRIFLIYGGLAAVYITMILGVVAAWTLGWVGRALGAVGFMLALGGIALMLRAPMRQWWTAIRAAVREHQLRDRLRGRSGRLITAGGGLLIAGIVVPRPLTVDAGFVAMPVRVITAVAPDSGIAEAVLVDEGTRVATGAPLVRLRNRSLEREAAAAERTLDSLARTTAAARAAGAAAAARASEAAWEGAAARSAGLRGRLAGLTLRAQSAGVVITPRTGRLTGRAFDAGEAVLTVGETDSVELRIPVAGAGAGGIRAGQTVWLLPHSSYSRVRGEVAAVAASGDPADGSVEVRVRLPARPGLVAGTSGSARIELAGSNLWGAIWWDIRRLVRTDLFL
jgi:putative peptide zinc metalloprotease protein